MINNIVSSIRYYNTFLILNITIYKLLNYSQYHTLHLFWNIFKRCIFTTIRHSSSIDLPSPIKEFFFPRIKKPVQKRTPFPLPRFSLKQFPHAQRELLAPSSRGSSARVTRPYDREPLSGAMWCPVATRAGRVGPYKRVLCAASPPSSPRLNSRMRPRRWPTIRVRFIEKSRGARCHIVWPVGSRGGSNTAHDATPRDSQDLLFLLLTCQ